MTDLAPDRWQCRECGKETTADAMVKIADPEDESNVWSICPHCRSAEQWERLCDEPGCKRVSSSGTPVKDARRYVWSCHEHAP